MLIHPDIVNETFPMHWKTLNFRIQLHQLICFLYYSSFCQHTKLISFRGPARIYLMVTDYDIMYFILFYLGTCQRPLGVFNQHEESGLFHGRSSCSNRCHNKDVEILEELDLQGPEDHTTVPRTVLRWPQLSTVTTNSRRAQLMRNLIESEDPDNLIRLTLDYPETKDHYTPIPNMEWGLTSKVVLTLDFTASPRRSCLPSTRSHIIPNLPRHTQSPTYTGQQKVCHLVPLTAPTRSGW